MAIAPTHKHSVIKSKQWLTEKILKIDLRMKNPLLLKFEPGQFISINLDKNVYRAYSIASDSNVQDYISLIASVSHEGIGADFLKNSPKGSDVYFIGPSGRFKLKEDNLPNIDELIFIATGTGIAPFIPMLYRLVKLNYTKKVTLFWGLRFEKDVFYQDILATFKDKLPGFTYNITLTQPTINWKSLSGRVQQHITIPAPKNTNIYACGHPDMVEQVRSLAYSLGYNFSNFFSEKFTIAKK
jgi:CDP-4-dehydro-6-deoxyglucose reductase